MAKIPSKDRLPAWISEYLPKELAESALFRFDIKLQAIVGYKCVKCGKVYDRRVPECPECEVEVKREHQNITVDLLPDLDLDYNDLEEQMQDIPAQYAFWSSVYSEARLKVAIEERRLKATRGRLIETTQRRAAQENIRLTNDQVKIVVESEQGMMEADMRLQNAQMQCGKLYHMLEALKMKSELARSLAGFKRQEQDRS